MPDDSYSNSIIANTIAKWKETYELSFELADVTFTILNELVDYCKSHNIPFIEEKGTWNLVLKARSIFTEIQELNSPTFNARKLITDEFLQRKRTDKDFTEPEVAVRIDPSIDFCIEPLIGSK